MWCSDPLSDGIAQSIAQMEGYNTPGTVARRNNNPGNIMSGGTFRTYPTEADGWGALCNQIRLNIGRGLTLEEFFGGRPGVYAGYAPAGHGGNDPAAYAAFVASRVGIPSNATIADFVGLPGVGSDLGLPGDVDWILVAAAVGAAAALYLIVS